MVIATAFSFIMNRCVFDSTLARRDTRTRELARPDTRTERYECARLYTRTKRVGETLYGLPIKIIYRKLNKKEKSQKVGAFRPCIKLTGRTPDKLIGNQPQLNQLTKKEPEEFQTSGSYIGGVPRYKKGYLISSTRFIHLFEELFFKLRS